MYKKFAPILLIVALAALAVGVIYWQNQGQSPLPFKQAVPDTQNQATQQPTSIMKSEVDISKWKTYRNEKYGYEIKYPDNYKIGASTARGSFLVSQKPPAEVFFSVFDNPKLMSLSKWLVSDLGIHGPEEWVPTIVNGIEGLKSVTAGIDGGVGYDILIPHKEKVFQISLSTRTSGAENELAIFEKLFSTFKFIN